MQNELILLFFYNSFEYVSNSTTEKSKFRENIILLYYYIIFCNLSKEWCKCTKFTSEINRNEKWIFGSVWHRLLKFPSRLAGLRLTQHCRESRRWLKPSQWPHNRSQAFQKINTHTHSYILRLFTAERSREPEIKDVLVALFVLRCLPPWTDAKPNPEICTPFRRINFFKWKDFHKENLCYTISTKTKEKTNCLKNKIKKDKKFVWHFVTECPCFCMCVCKQDLFVHRTP